MTVVCMFLKFYHEIGILMDKRYLLKIFLSRAMVQTFCFKLKA